MAKQKVKKVLTRDQLERILLTPCKTEQELKHFIKYFFEMQLPDCIVSRYADTDPFHVVWEVYDICVNKNNPQKIQELLYVAARGSGKTLGMAIAEMLVMLHDKRDVVHVGAILSQAKRCYSYQTKFLLSSKIKPIVMPHDVPEDMRILEKNNMEKSIFNIGGIKATLEVIPCTMKAVNGPHVPLICVDEIDTVTGEGLKAYLDIGGMLDSKGNQKALRIGISTRKSRFGLMNRAMENAEKEGRTVRKWTVLEFTERCSDVRSGTTPTIGYVDQEKMVVLSEAEFARKDPVAQKEYFACTFPGEHCTKCLLGSLCLGDSKKQKSKSPMLKPIEDAIKKAVENGPDWAISQLFNLKPSIEGIIYKEFEEKLHVKDWNEMWKILTDVEFPGVCTHDIFVKKCNDLKLSCYAGIDWGWSNPSTLVVFYVDARENIFVVRADGRTFYNNSNWVHFIKTRWHNVYRIQLYFPDLANPGDAMLLRDAGLTCPTTVAKNVPDGIQVVKKWLRSLASPLPKMFFARETCGPIIQEFQMYHYEMDASGQVSDTPSKEYDHWLDALRYPMFGLFGKGGAVTGGYGLDITGDPVIDKSGSYFRAPSAEEFAKVSGIQLNVPSEADLKKVGEIGTISQLNDDNDDNGGVEGGGGFLWSF